MFTDTTALPAPPAFIAREGQPIAVTYKQPFRFLKRTIFVLLFSINFFSFAAEKDFTTSLTPLSVFDYNLNKFNEYSFDYCFSCRKARDKSLKSQCLAFLGYLSVKKGEKPFRLDVSIVLFNDVLFHKQDSTTKQYIFETILQEIESELRRKVSYEIKKENLFGKITWSSFSNAAKKEYNGTAFFEKGKVIDVKVKVNDYFDPTVRMGTITEKGLVDENGMLMEDLTEEGKKNRKLF